jgi:hypothetical protein
MVKVSNSGYKRTSKDAKEAELIIPSRYITMKDVPHPVLGISNTGDAKLMFPEEDYTFDGDYVREIPMMQTGGGWGVDTSDLNFNPLQFMPDDSPLKKAFENIIPQNTVPIKTSSINNYSFKNTLRTPPKLNINNILPTETYENLFEKKMLPWLAGNYAASKIVTGSSENEFNKNDALARLIPTIPINNTIDRGWGQDTISMAQLGGLFSGGVGEVIPTFIPPMGGIVASSSNSFSNLATDSEVKGLIKEYFNIPYYNKIKHKYSEISTNNNNAGNVIFTKTTKKYGATQGDPQKFVGDNTPNTKKTNYAYFNNVEDSIYAMYKILSSPLYDLPLEKALKLYVFGDANSSKTPSYAPLVGKYFSLNDTNLKDMSSDDKLFLIALMMKGEGAAGKLLLKDSPLKRKFLKKMEKGGVFYLNDSDIEHYKKLGYSIEYL